MPEVITPMRVPLGGRYAPDNCPKIDLRQVTLYVMEERDPKRALALMYAMLDVADWGDVIWDNRAKSYEAFTIREYHVHENVNTPFIFEMHLDGFILNPDLWNPNWLNYDYIGSPWPAGVYPHQVGNSGFSIRSVELSKFNAKLPIGRKHPAIDISICQDNRGHLERAGFKFAPLKEAAIFGQEATVPETPKRTFGFHGDWKQTLPPPPFYWRSKTTRTQKT